MIFFHVNGDHTGVYNAQPGGALVQIINGCF